jgi:hypothetical protein
VIFIADVLVCWDCDNLYSLKCPDMLLQAVSAWWNLLFWQQVKYVCVVCVCVYGVFTEVWVGVKWLSLCISAESKISRICCIHTTVYAKLLLHEMVNQYKILFYSWSENSDLMFCVADCLLCFGDDWSCAIIHMLLQTLHWFHNNYDGVMFEWDAVLRLGNLQILLF